jgi:hypothetical protein
MRSGFSRIPYHERWRAAVLCLQFITLAAPAA